MPTYEYECDKCREVFEIRQRISEPALTIHEGCGGSVRRLLSAAPFILKGDGWYVTDYPSEARKKALSAEKSGSTAPSTGTSSEDKSASTSDTAKSGSTTPAAPSTGSSSPSATPSSKSSSSSTTSSSSSTT